MNKLLVAVAALSIVVLGIGSFLAWRLLSETNPSTTPTPTPQVSETTTPTPEVGSKQKRVAYVKDNSIWLINPDGSDKTQLFPSTNSIIRALNWKSPTELSFIRCALTCQLVTTTISSKSEKIEVEHPQILALDWSTNGNQLAYIYSLPDGQMKLNLKSGTLDNTVKNFFAGPGRGGSLDDEVSIHFSPDDKYILVTNTLTTGNPQDKNTIWVLETNTSKEMLAIPIGENGWPTQAKWFLNDRFLYKVGNNLYYQWVDGDPEFISSITNFYNPTKEIHYWINSKGLPSIGKLVAATPKKLLDGYFKPHSLDDSNIISLKAGKVSEEESILPFESVGLSMVNTDTKEELVLDSGNINLFAVLP